MPDDQSTDLTDFTDPDPNENVTDSDADEPETQDGTAEAHNDEDADQSSIGDGQATLTETATPTQQTSTEPAQPDTGDAGNQVPARDTVQAESAEETGRERDPIRDPDEPLKIDDYTWRDLPRIAVYGAYHATDAVLKEVKRLAGKDQRDQAKFLVDEITPGADSDTGDWIAAGIVYSTLIVCLGLVFVGILTG